MAGITLVLFEAKREPLCVGAKHLLARPFACSTNTAVFYGFPPQLLNYHCMWACLFFWVTPYWLALKGKPNGKPPLEGIPKERQTHVELAEWMRRSLLAWAFCAAAAACSSPPQLWRRGFAGFSGHLKMRNHHGEFPLGFP